MPDQAQRLRELHQQLTPAGLQAAPGLPLVAVTSGRAGVGTSTVAVNLAAILADWGDRVLLVDAAAERNSLGELAGVEGSRRTGTLTQVLTGRCSAAQAIVPGPSGAMLLADPERSSSRLDTSRGAQQRLLAGLQSLAGDFDLVVLDIGSGLTAWTRRFWLQAQLLLLVTTTEPSALMDSYATIKMSVADGIGPDVRLVVNACEDDRLAAETHCRIASACSRFLGLPLPALPALPRCEGADPMQRLRVWDAPDTPFGHASMWLARAARDLLHPASTTPSLIGAA